RRPSRAHRLRGPPERGLLAGSAVHHSPRRDGVGRDSDTRLEHPRWHRSRSHRARPRDALPTRGAAHPVRWRRGGRATLRADAGRPLLGDLMKILITGVAGFIGSNLAAGLLSRGHTVIGVDNMSQGEKLNMVGFADHPQFTFHLADILDKEAVLAVA